MVNKISTAEHDRQGRWQSTTDKAVRQGGELAQGTVRITTGTLTCGRTSSNKLQVSWLA